jgi:hypothetical protein
MADTKCSQDTPSTRRLVGFKECLGFRLSNRRLTEPFNCTVGSVYRGGGNRRHSLDVVHSMRSPFSASGT